MARKKAVSLWRTFSPSAYQQSILVLQTSDTRSINVGFIQKLGLRQRFVPARLNFGPERETDTYAATVSTLKLPPIRRLLRRFDPQQISTVTVLRETLSCRLGSALDEVGIHRHYGDAFIGASHIKGKGEIKTAYLYENVEGLVDHGLWIITESICIGRNLAAALESLLSKFRPREILMICPIASREGINNVGKIIADHQVTATFVAWGALFGVDSVTKYDMPWGHPDTEPLDIRDQNLFVSIYGDSLCMGGDFGNNYYCPPLALKLYEDQLKQLKVTPQFPAPEEIKKTYTPGEFLIR